MKFGANNRNLSDSLHSDDGATTSAICCRRCHGRTRQRATWPSERGETSSGRQCWRYLFMDCAVAGASRDRVGSLAEARSLSSHRPGVRRRIDPHTRNDAAGRQPATSREPALFGPDSGSDRDKDSASATISDPVRHRFFTATNPHQYCDADKCAPCPTTAVLFAQTRRAWPQFRRTRIRRRI
jgi:hypothetical protein